MSTLSLFRTPMSVRPSANESRGEAGVAEVSEFVTVQSLANFGLMTGAISAAWHASRLLWPRLASRWVPFGLAAGWGLVSLLISVEGFKQQGGGTRTAGVVASAVFVATINVFVLFGAVIGAEVATGQSA